MVTIFVSHRRDSASDLVRRLVDGLRTRLGSEFAVFSPGAFEQADRKALEGCDLVIVAIDPGGLSDVQVTELEVALKRGITVMPLLVDGARISDEKTLRADLKPLAHLEAGVIGQSSFSADLDRHAHSIERMFARGVSEPRPSAKDSVIQTKRFDAEWRLPEESTPSRRSSVPDFDTKRESRWNARLKMDSLLGRLGGILGKSSVGGEKSGDSSEAKEQAGGLLPADFSVVAPPLIRAGQNFFVELWVAPSARRQEMVERATRPGRMQEVASRSQVRLARGTPIVVLLRLPDFEVAEPSETLIWSDDISNVGFPVKAPAQLPPGTYSGSAKLLDGKVAFASISFDLTVVPANQRLDASPKPVDMRLELVRRAFASYASQDRRDVLRCVQGIQTSGTKVFLDIVDLRSGEKWEPALYREIGTSDRFYLFWSSSAAKSEWVEREWRYALKQKGIDFISPVPLEDPRDAKPPVELQDRHFNDMLLAFIKAEDVRRLSSSKP